MNKLFFLLLFPAILFGCTSMRALSSSEVLGELYRDPKIEVGTIEITDYKNLPGDPKQASNFLRNIILSKKHQLSSSPDYIINLSIKEQSFSKKLDQIYTVTLTMIVIEKKSNNIVYRGILIKEGKMSYCNSYPLFKLIKESYSRFKSNCRAKRQIPSLNIIESKE